MNKVGFFRSIQLKFIIIYILLLLIAVQVIGSYVARELEDRLTSNFEDSVNNRIDYLTYNLRDAFIKEREEDKDERTLREDIRDLVNSVDPDEITNLQVINDVGRVIGANNYNGQNKVGKKTTDDDVLRALSYN